MRDKVRGEMWDGGVKNVLPQKAIVKTQVVQDA
jgi:hypothetical protein